MDTTSFMSKFHSSTHIYQPPLRKMDEEQGLQRPKEKYWGHLNTNPLVLGMQIMEKGMSSGWILLMLPKKKKKKLAPLFRGKAEGSEQNPLKQRF